MFTEDQISFMQGIGLKMDFSNLSDEDYIRIEDVVGDVYTAEVQEHENETTPVILLCEAILGKLT